MKRIKQWFRSVEWKIDLDLERNPTLLKIRNLPTGKRVAVVAGAVLFVWMALEQWSWSWARSWSDEADRVELALSDARSLSSSVDPQAQTGAEFYGPIEPPSTENDGAQAMAEAVNAVVKKHATSGFSYDAQRASSRLSGAASVGGSGDRLSRVSGEVRFDATPAEAVKIISELESNPAIEAISALRIDKIENESRVTVRLTVEAWVFGARTPGRRA
jgi:hypothetical protein